MTEYVAPMYANTHTETSATGRQTSHLREEARGIIAAILGADRLKYATVFAGTGMTGALSQYTWYTTCPPPRCPYYASAQFRLEFAIIGRFHVARYIRDVHACPLGCLSHSPSSESLRSNATTAIPRDF